ncbi:PUMILIO-like protein 15 [Salix koriyanagi]|uniref:PUMILIO-like protein 15 n=1 Tax=Salix koriyanagi TaxID=2511006 RepID=A0A9Q0TDQ5_9ROSI|nr:PUMILIO-like protein 15 [Salix koriyanagi]
MDPHHHQRRGFLAGTAPLSPETPVSRFIDQSAASPQTSTQSPYSETLEAAFLRLNLSRDNQTLNSGSHDNIVNVSAVNFNNLDYFASDGLVGFLPAQNNDINPFGATRVRDFVHNPMMARSNSDLRSNAFVYSGAYQNPNLNSRRGLMQRESHYGSMNNVLVSKNQNYGRRPLWLQDHVSWEDLSGMIVALAKDQHGCKFLQRFIESATREQVDMLFYEVIDYTGGLIVDPFGNYVVQKLIEVISEDQRTRILRNLTRTDFQLARICLDVHGTRAVQKLLNCITNPAQVSLVVSALNQGAVALIKDSNGHHVIQHSVKHFSPQDNKYILKKRGEPRDRLVAEIIANALLLAEDHYGNYVVQHILDLKMPQVTENLLAQFEGSYMALSCNKYGSNVVEKCLLTTSEDQSTQIILELLSNPGASMLLVDPFGNFVIQKALLVSQYKCIDNLDFPDSNCLKTVYCSSFGVADYLTQNQSVYWAMIVLDLHL